MTALFKDWIAYGADYNPEQWDEQTVLEDLDLMVEAGVTMVSPAIFAWAKLEPHPGVFDLDWLEDLLDRLHARGIAVDLATGTASPPVWMGKTWPETLPIDSLGRTLKHGSRQAYNPSSKVFQERMALLVTEMAARFAHHPAVVSWHVSNELGCHVNESFDPESTEAFQDWLRRKYGTLEELNRAWGTAFWSQWGRRPAAP